MQKIKILHLLDTKGFGGNQEHIRVLAKYFDKEKYELSAVIAGEGLFKDILEEYGVRVYCIPIRSKFDVIAFIRLIRLMRKERFLIVHTHIYVSDVIGSTLARLSGVPVCISTLHDRINMDEYGRRKWRWTTFIYKFILKYLFTRRDAIEQIKIFSSKIVHIVNGTDLEKLDIKVDREKKKMEVGFKAETPLVGIVARLKGHNSYKKGHKYFLEAASIILKDYPNTEFLVIGDGSSQSYLENLAESLGIRKKVHFLGFRTDVLELMSILDISVLPSLFEGLPRTLMEAMGLSIPCVATGVDGIPELIENNVTGILVPPRDSKSLARGIITLLNDKKLAIHIASEGKKKIFSEYSGEIMVERTQKIYEELLSKKINIAFYYTVCKRNLRRILGRLGYFIIGSIFNIVTLYKFRRKYRIASDRINNILVILRLKIGDVTVALPFFETLKKNFPESKISVFVSSVGKQLLEQEPYIDELVSWGDNGLREKINFFYTMIKKSFDLSIVLDYKFSSNSIAFLSGAKWRIGYDFNGRGFLLNYAPRALPYVFVPAWKYKNIVEFKHQSEIYLELLKEIGMEKYNKNIQWHFSEQEILYSDRLLSKYNIEHGKLLIAIHPVVEVDSRQWPLERFAKLADRLHDKYKAEIIITGSIKERNKIDELLRFMKHNPINIAGNVNLRELALVLKKCKLLVTLDTGIMHLSSAVGVPTVAIFGPGESRVWYPYGIKHRVIYKKELRCIGCKLSKCPRQNHLCMNLLSTDDVYREVSSVLDTI